MGKLILKLFAVLVLLLVMGLVGLYLFRNTLVRAGVIRGGEYATRQKTGLEMADLSFGSHSLGLSQLDIANINLEDRHYKEPKLLTMRQCSIDVDTWSLLSNEAKINEITISGLEITLETNQNFKNNLADLIEILKQQSPATHAPPAEAAKNGGTTGNAPAESPGKKLKIGVVRLAGTKVHLRGIVSMDLDLGPIEMKDPTNPDGRPMKIADLMTKVLLHISQQIVDDPRIPGNIKDAMKNVDALVKGLNTDLQKDLKNFQNVGKQIQDITKDPLNAGKNLQDLGKNAGNLGKDMKDQGKNLQDAGKNIGNLLGGNKTTQPK
jgi:hypothetical protein